MERILPHVTRIYQNHTLDSARWNCYQPCAGDVVIATSYKSGTTWMQEIVRQLIFQGADAPPRHQLSLWLDDRRNPIDEVISKLEAQQHRRFIKSHLPLDGLPFFSEVQYIVVGRDARDVFMSVWNHHANFTPDFLEKINSIPGRVGAPMPAAPDDIHDFWRDWICRGWFAWESEGYPWWGNLHHTQSWWNYRHLPNILFVHYNDLSADLTGEMRRIAAFLGISLPEESLPGMLQILTLDAMREEAVRNEDPNRPSSFKDGARTFFFKGTNGRWKDVLTAEEVQMYEEKAAQVLTPDCRAWLEQGRVAL
ncbi:MAG: sulfotransferase domain-containing protein [Caldilineaceae bacterium]|nr:sulfotransferase domain-containing protein [Caldilineaceae bacterium]